MILKKFLLDIKKQELALSILPHKGIVKKHLRKNFFEEIGIPVLFAEIQIKKQRPKF